MAVEQDNRKSSRPLFRAGVELHPKVSVMPGDLEAFVAGFCKAYQQLETSNIKKARNLKASHADPLVRLQSEYRTSTNFGAHYVASLREVKGYRYILR
jgi:hypothetical protein